MWSVFWVCVSLFIKEIMFFFFFKHKTAYEMRISDWSSDVCSSDLLDHHARAIAIRRLDDAILDALEQAGLVEQRHDALARREPVEADQVGGDEAVGGLRDLGRGIEHVEHQIGRAHV